MITWLNVKLEQSGKGLLELAEQLEMKRRELQEMFDEPKLIPQHIDIENAICEYVGLEYHLLRKEYHVEIPYNDAIRIQNQLDEHKELMDMLSEFQKLSEYMAERGIGNYMIVACQNSMKNAIGEAEDLVRTKGEEE